MSDALITSADLELILQITIADANLKTALIAIASDFIESFTNRKLLSQTYTKEAYDGEGGHYIYLKNFPVTVLTLVESWDTYNNIQLYGYTENTEYIPYLTEGYVYMYAKTAKGNRNYRVTYTAGYVIGSMPYDIRNACAQLAGLVYANTMKSGMKSESIGKYSYTIDKGDLTICGIPVPADIAGVLNYYRRRNI
jgi:hypothetical protein